MAPIEMGSGRFAACEQAMNLGLQMGMLLLTLALTTACWTPQDAFKAKLCESAPCWGVDPGMTNDEECNEERCDLEGIEFDPASRQ